MTTQQTAATAPSHQRFLTLDALRGLAAMAVALFHYHKPLMPGGYLAVDFFFALSGFVLVRTAAPRFGKGLGVGRFIRQRLVRLYPLHLVGVAIGSVVALQRIARHVPGDMGTGEIIVAGMLNPLMLPSPLSAELFPLNDPAWSLFFELLANIAMALVLTRLRRGALLAIVAVAGAGLVLAVSLTPVVPDGMGIARSALDGGNLWGSFAVGLARVSFSFTLGMVLARLPLAPVRPRSIGALLCCLALLTLLTLPVSGASRLACDLAVVVCASPLLIHIAARLEPQHLFTSVAGFVGDVSFALYATHLPVVTAFLALERRVHVPAGTFAPAFLLAALALAWACQRWIDGPARRALGRLILR